MFDRDDLVVDDSRVPRRHVQPRVQDTIHRGERSARITMAMAEQRPVAWWVAVAPSSTPPAGVRERGLSDSEIEVAMVAVLDDVRRVSVRDDLTIGNCPAACNSAWRSPEHL
ncbi:hypothetical protein EEB14_09310 [Rhodococcus sp. WS4]|nr:hypothetical protein EEB14_09310 [Rhodococcus sp. WS4]